MLEIFLLALMVIYAPIPWVTILIHSFATNKKLISRKASLVLTVVLWSVVAAFAYPWLPVIFGSKFSALLLQVIGAVLITVAALIEWLTRKKLGSARILGSSEFKQHPPTYNDQLITSGIYHWARHPRYVEHPFWFLGLGLILGYPSLLIFALYLAITFAVASKFEEKELLHRYGNAYVNYAKQTPAFFIRIGCNKSHCG